MRVRPLSSKERSNGTQSCVNVLDNSVVVIQKSSGDGGYLKSQQAVLNEYVFDVALGEDETQSQVYNKTTKNYVPKLLEGQNVTVFAYGATGAGKTHTMFGNTRCDSAAENEEAGIIPNAVNDLFEILEVKRNNLVYGEHWSIEMSYSEVYNEQVYDLLDPTGKPLSVREDQTKGVVVVAGLTQQVVESYEDVVQRIYIGNSNRKTEATMANVVSSRSHAIIQLKAIHTQIIDDKETSREAKLCLIDLAGSERASATNNKGDRLNEAANINKSLLALANCINALAENSGSNTKRLNVKYRDSKLTHLLKSSLEGNCNLIMIANINPSHLTYEDSHNTLKYSNRAKNIKVNPVAFAS